MSLPPSERTPTLPETNFEEEEKNESSHGGTRDATPIPLDGGLRGWSTVAGSWFMLFSTLGYLYSFGVYQDFYTRIYLPSSSTSSIAWMGSVQLALPYLMGMPVGRLFDAGYIHSVLAVGSMIFLFSLFMLSLAQPDHYYQVGAALSLLRTHILAVDVKIGTDLNLWLHPQMFLSQGLGMGIGVGCVQLHSATIVSRHFVQRRALAYGIALTGASVGSVVFPIVLNRLIYSMGFADAVRVSGYISAGGLMLGNLLVRTPARKVTSGSSPTSFTSFLKDPAFMFFIFGTVISFFGFYFPIIYIQLYAIEQSIDTNMAFYSIAILNGSGVVGRVIGNYMADVFGLFNIQVPCTFMTAALIWLVLAIKNVSSLVAVSALYGLFSGAWLSLCMAATAVLSKSPSEIGARTGMTMGSVGISVLFSAPIQGAVLGKDNTWIRSVAVSASFMLVGAFLTLVAGYLIRTGRRGPS